MNNLNNSVLEKEAAQLQHDLFVEQGNNKLLAEKIKNIRRLLDADGTSSGQLLRDIERIKEEKRTMRDWLERGVAEAERVSVQLVHLAEEVQHADKRVEELDRELQDLDERYSDTQRLIHESNYNQSSLRHQQVEKDPIEAAQTDFDEVGSSVFPKEVDVEQKNAGEMRGSAAGMESAETAMECLAACSRQTLHQLEKMTAALNAVGACETGGESIEIDNESGDPEDTADNTRDSPLDLDSSIAIVDRCDDSLRTIWSLFSRMASDQAHQHRQKEAELQEAYMAVEANLEDTIADSSAHLQQIREELAMWRQKCDDIKTMLLSSGTHKSEETESGFKDAPESAFDEGYGKAQGSFVVLMREKRTALLDESNNLQMTKDLLQQKLETAENDYRAVKEMKRAYHDLELKKSEMKQVNVQLRKNNRSIKLRTWEATPLKELRVPGK